MKQKADAEYRMPADMQNPADPATDMSLEFSEKPLGAARKPEPKRRTPRRILLAAAVLAIGPHLLGNVPMLPAGQGLPVPASPELPAEPLADPVSESAGYEGKLEFVLYDGSVWTAYERTSRCSVDHYTYLYHTPDGEPEHIDFGELHMDWQTFEDDKLNPFLAARGLNPQDARRFFQTGDNVMSCRIEDEEHFRTIPRSSLPAGWQITDSLPADVDFTRRHTSDDYHPISTQPAPSQSGVYESGIYGSGVYESGVYQSGVYESGVYQSGVYQSGIYQSGINQQPTDASDYEDDPGSADSTEAEPETRPAYAETTSQSQSNVLPGDPDDEKSYYMSLRVDNDAVYGNSDEEKQYRLMADTHTFHWFVVPNPGDKPEYPEIGTALNMRDPDAGGPDQGYAGLQAVDPDSVDLDQKFFTLTMRPTTMREVISDTEETLHYITYYLYFDRSEIPDLKLPYYEREDSPYPEIIVSPSASLKEQLADLARAYGIDPARLRFHSGDMTPGQAVLREGSEYAGDSDSVLDMNVTKGMRTYSMYHKIRLVLAPETAAEPAETELTLPDNDMVREANALAAEFPKAEPIAEFPGNLFSYGVSSYKYQFEETLDDGTTRTVSIRFMCYGNPPGGYDDDPITQRPDGITENLKEWFRWELEAHGYDLDKVEFYDVHRDDHANSGYTDENGNSSERAELQYRFLYNKGQ